MTARARARRHTGRNPVAIGLVVLVIVTVGTFLGFTKDIPFTTPFQVEATFESANSIRPGSPVRIAGVNVGTVKGKALDKGGARTIIDVEMDERYAPIPTDTRAILRQKTLLGETYVELTPGDPASGMLEEGDVLVRPTEGWTAVGPRVRCFAIEDARVHLVDRPRLDAWMHDPALAANVVRVLSAQIATASSPSAGGA